MIFAYVLFFSFIAVFLATAWATIGGLIGKLPVGAGYLKILVSALLVEVAAALVFQFKTLDLTTTPQQLEKEIMAVQMPVKEVGSQVKAKEKLAILIDSYRNHAQAYSDLTACQSELAKTRDQLAGLKALSDRLSLVFRNPAAIQSVSAAVDDLMANEAARPLIDQSCAKYNFYDVTQPEFVWRVLKGLKPEDPVSQSLLALRKRGLGPFSSEEFMVFVSVPTPSKLEKDEAIVRSDSPFQDNWIHLVDVDSGGEVWVQGRQLHERKPILDSKSGQRCELIQISLDAAAQLFRSPTFETSRKQAQATVR